MNSLKFAILTGACLTAAACVTTAGEGEYVYIGDIPAVCPITINQVKGSTSERFRVTPLEAVRAASSHGSVKCNSIFLQQVYADGQNYYIIKSAFASMSQKRDAVVVNGDSGEVSVRRQEYVQ